MMNSLASRVLNSLDQLPTAQTPSLYGRVCRFDGQFIECDGFPAPIGSLCEIDTITGTAAMAEIIGFNQGRNMLAMLDHDAKICDGAMVRLINTQDQAGTRYARFQPEPNLRPSRVPRGHLPRRLGEELLPLLSGREGPARYEA